MSPITRMEFSAAAPKRNEYHALIAQVAKVGWIAVTDPGSPERYGKPYSPLKQVPKY